MHRLTVAIVLSVLALSSATYLPTVFWDPTNPILKSQFWDEVVQVKIYDILTFICPNDFIRFTGRESRSSLKGLYHNLYVKEIPADIKNFDGACDTSENATLIAKCEKTKDNIHNIEINSDQPLKHLPKFNYSRDYMFFATSDGTRKSLNTTSKNCTMIFRVHVNTFGTHTPYPTCPLFGRDRVCEVNSTPVVEDCKKIIPEEVNVTITTPTSVTVTWQRPRDTSCNITFYTVCYKESMTAPCKEVLVQAKQHNVTLHELGSKEKYFVQVRAHTTKGPGDYCKEIAFETEEARDLKTSAQEGNKQSSIDGKSIAIGFVIGVVLAIILVVAFWLVVTRIYKRKDDCKTKDESENTSRNNPNFYKGEEPLNDVIKLNDGYRQSGQNWKLPAVQEENLHLYTSEA